MSRLWICLVVFLLIQQCHAVFWSQQFLQRAFTPAHYNFTESVKFAAPTCIEEYQNFVRGLFAAEPWAQRVLDSWTLTTSGLFSGNQYNYGHFDQCLESLFKGDKSQYCLMHTWNPNLAQGFWNGVCLPKSCTTEAVHTILANLYPNLDLVVQKVLVCSTKGTNENPYVYRAMKVFISIAILVILSTAYHLYFGSKKKLLTSFSLVRNARSLFGTRKDGQIEVLDGLRVLAMLGVLRLHVYSVLSKSVHTAYKTISTKSDAFTALEEEWWWKFVYGGNFSVDTFFIIAGFVMVLKLIRLIDQKKSLSLLNFFISRYVRLTAPVGFLILFVMAFYSSVQGPNTVDVLNELHHCEEKWWMNFLHLQGYLVSWRCMNHTWYVAVNAHLCLLAPILFFCLRKCYTKFLVGLSTLVIVISPVGLILHRMDYRFDFMYHNFLTHTRMSPWFIGILLGLAVYNYQSRNRMLSLRLSRGVVIVSIAVIIKTYYAPLFANVSAIYGMVYDTIKHVLFGTAISFIIFALVNEPKGQPSFFTKILSYPNLQFFSKLSYSFYLLHAPIIQLLYATHRNPMYVTEVTITIEAIIVFWVTILAAIPFTLLFEMPFVNLCSALFPE